MSGLLTFGTFLHLRMEPAKIEVQMEVQAAKAMPKLDILLLRPMGQETWNDEQRALLPDGELLEVIPTSERLKGIPISERLDGISASERLKGIPASELLEDIPTSERLKGVPASELPCKNCLRQI